MSNSSPRSFRSRMGTVMRRTSSVLTMARPGTPTSSDSGSVKGVEPPSAPPPLAPPTNAVSPEIPSPIPESPAREAAANNEDQSATGPSPLSNEVVPSPITDVPPVLDPAPVEPTAPSVPEPPSDSNITAAVQPVEAPVPVAETDSNTTAVVQPVEAPVAETDSNTTAAVQPVEAPVAETELPKTTVTRIFESATGPGAFTDEPEELPPRENGPVAEVAQGSAQDNTPNAGDSQPTREVVADSSAAPDTPPGLEMPAPTYFDHKSPTVAVESITVSTPEFKKAVDENTSEDQSPSSQTTARPPEADVSVKFDEPFVSVAMPAPPVIDDHPASIPLTAPAAAPTYDLDFSGNNLWGSNVSKQNSPARSTIPVPVEDPFADPVPSINPPKITVTHEIPDEPDVIVMPSPIHNVRPSRSTASMRSGIPSSSHGHYEHDETRPLLDRPNTPQGYLSGSTIPRHHLSQGTLRGIGVPLHVHAGDSRRLRDLGWLEYVLPDATLYYVHPTLRVTTDIDLRQPKNLDAVTTFFDRQKDAGEHSVGGGMELWLREAPEPASKKKRGDWFVPLKAWVDHRKKTVVLDPVWHGSSRGARRAKSTSEDALDVEYRYWSFMDTHPAHVALPHTARAEAMDILTWAWTDRLLPANRATPAPFSQEECQELMNLLRSFGEHQSDAGIQPILQTRIVARILLRTAHWRQIHFRPDKPLPRDAVQHPAARPAAHRPFRRAFLDFVVSCFCLGIPYLFFTRTQQQRLDEESGLRSAGPIFMIGACTCLMAAIVLSASVTFLSLPGLDNISRVVGFVAILLASFSMASTLVAILRFKSDVERGVSFVGGEGLMMLTHRSVIMSLPVVFLVYAVIAFVSGIALYSFRGVTLTDKNLVEHHFEDYTRWTVVGVIGGLTGILFTSLLILRR